MAGAVSSYPISRCLAPAQCLSDWKVRDVVAHLVEIAQFYVRTLVYGVQGAMARLPVLAPPIVPGPIHQPKRRKS